MNGYAIDTVIHAEMHAGDKSAHPSEPRKLQAALPRSTSFSAEDKSVTLELIKLYRTTRSPKVRDRLVRLNIGLVRKEVSYWTSQRAEAYDDLIQVGAIGLLGAFDRFELDKGYAFSSFATRYIRGEIQHYLRDRSTVMRVPRRWLELHQQAGRVTRLLRERLQREPSAAEIAEALGISVEEWQEVRLAQRNRSPLSLDAPLVHDDECAACLLEMVPDPKCQPSIDRYDCIRLQQALSHLEARTREILEYVYLHDYTQKDVAKMYGVSAVTISRQVRRGIEELRRIVNVSA